MAMTAEEAMAKLDHFNTDQLQPLMDIYDEYTYPLKSFITYINSIQGKFDEYAELLSWCDQAREDILHYLEFDSPNAVERNKLMKKLISIQKTRRVVKTHLECAQTVNDAWIKCNLINLHKNATDVVGRLTKLSTRYYTDRTNVVRETLGLTEEES